MPVKIVFKVVSMRMAFACPGSRLRLKNGLEAMFANGLVPRERSGVLNDLSQLPDQKAQIRLQNVIEQRDLYACSAVHVHGECNNYILYAVDPAPCEKKCRSEQPDPLPLFRGGVW